MRYYVLWSFAGNDSYIETEMDIEDWLICNPEVSKNLDSYEELTEAEYEDLK